MLPLQEYKMKTSFFPERGKFRNVKLKLKKHEQKDANAGCLTKTSYLSKLSHTT